MGQIWDHKLPHIPTVYKNEKPQSDMQIVELFLRFLI